MIAFPADGAFKKSQSYIYQFVNKPVQLELLFNNYFELNKSSL